MDSSFSPIWAMFMLVLVVATVPISVWVMRRLPAWRPVGGSTLTIMETLSLGPRERLLVVRSGSRHLLIGATGQSISLVSELPDYPTQADIGLADKPVRTSLKGNFATLLQKASNDRQA